MFWLYGYVISFSLSIIMFFVTSRYRVQISPILCIFAAHALVHVVPGALRNIRYGLRPLVVIVVLVIATQPGFFALPSEEVQWREYTHEARRLSQAGRYAEAVEAADKAIELQPDAADSYLCRAIVHKEGSKLFPAISDYSKAVGLAPDLPTVRYDFAQTLRQIKMYEPAIEEYTAAIELDPAMTQAYNNLGITYRDMKRFDKAIEAFERVIELDPKYTKAYNNLGASLAESGDLNRAIPVLKKAIDVDPGYANTYKNLAMAYIQAQNVEDAYRSLTRYVEMRPDDQRAVETLGKLRMVVQGDTLREGQ
jgi:tetratricopeptide (TPR) repeat protein